MNYKVLMDRSRAFISASGASIKKFCDRCGLSASMYYKWTAGLTPISDDKAAAIERFLESFGY